MKPRLFTRNFTVLLLGQAWSLVGNFTLKFAISMYILEQSGSAAVFSAMLAISMVPTILLSPFGGILADRADRRSVMVALDALSGLAVLAAALLLPLGHEQVFLGALLVTLSVLAAFESPTVQACIPQMLPEPLLMRGNAAVSQIQAAASLATPFLGSVLYAAFGLTPVLCGAAICFFLTALLECFLRLEFRRRPRTAGIPAMIREEFAASARFLHREQPDILKLLLLAALASLFAAGTMVVGFPYLVRTVLDLSSAHYGAAESAMGLAAILGGLFVAALGQRLRLRHLAAVFLGLGLSLLPAGLAFSLPLDAFEIYLILLAAFCTGQFGCSVFSTCAISAIQVRTPERLMGKVLSCVFTLSLCAQPLGQILYGALFDRFSAAPGWVLIPSGLLICGIGAASARFFRKMEAPPS